MARPLRKEKMASFLRREIAVIVSSQLRDPRLGIVTINRCEVSGDLSQCIAYWTVLGGDKQKKDSEHALNQAAGHIQSIYAKSLHTRIVPRLVFRYDTHEVSRQRMEEIFQGLAAERGDAPAQILEETKNDSPEAK